MLFDSFWFDVRHASIFSSFDFENPFFVSLFIWSRIKLTLFWFDLMEKIMLLESSNLRSLSKANNYGVILMAKFPQQRLQQIWRSGKRKMPKS